MQGKARVWITATLVMAAIAAIAAIAFPYFANAHIPNARILKWDGTPLAFTPVTGFRDGLPFSAKTGATGKFDIPAGEDLPRVNDNMLGYVRRRTGAPDEYTFSPPAIHIFRVRGEDGEEIPGAEARIRLHFIGDMGLLETVDGKAKLEGAPSEPNRVDAQPVDQKYKIVEWLRDAKPGKIQWEIRLKVRDSDKKEDIWNWYRRGF